MNKPKLIKIHEPSDKIMETIKFVQEKTNIGSNSKAVEFALEQFLKIFDESAKRRDQIDRLSEELSLLIQQFKSLEEAKNKISEVNSSLSQNVNRIENRCDGEDLPYLDLEPSYF